jgi:DNA invertase Pin-like site-specific DNA recombinase
MTRASVKAAVYVRKSSDREATRAGVEAQETDCRYVCEREGFSVIEPVYSDNNRTAADPTKPRPEYERMMRDVAAGLVDVIVVTVPDRLHRQPIELEQFIVAAKAAGMHRVMTGRRDYDLTDPRAKKDMRDETADALYEVERLSERAKRRKVQHAEAGLPNGGGRPFGYLGNHRPESETEWPAGWLNPKTGEVKGGLVIDENEAALIREAATRLIDGASLCSIRDDWNARPVSTVTGAQWSLKTLTKMLTSWRLVGKREHLDEVHDAAWPAILDDTTRSALVNLLTTRRRPPAVRRYPLRGILVCAECGHSLVAVPRKVNGKGEPKRNYGCRKDSGGCGHVIISASAAENYLFGILLPLADSPSLVSIVAAEEGTERQRAGEVLEIIAAEEAKLRRFEDDYNAGDITGAQLRRATQAATERLTAAQGELSSLRGSNVLTRLGGHVRATWEEMDADDQRTVLLSLVHRVKVSQATKHGNRLDTGRLKVSWRYDALARAASGLWDAMTDEEKGVAWEASLADLTDEERYGDAG